MSSDQTASEPQRQLEPCPVCGGEDVSQSAELLAQDRIRCETCKLNFRRQDARGRR